MFLIYINIHVIYIYINIIFSVSVWYRFTATSIFILKQFPKIIGEKRKEKRFIKFAWLHPFKMLRSYK